MSSGGISTNNGPNPHNNTWEVVGPGKSGKKKLNPTESPNNKLSKNQKKKIAENMPKQKGGGAPINEDKTMFEAFLEKERRLEEKNKRGSGANGASSGGEMKTSNGGPGATGGHSAPGQQEGEKKKNANNNNSNNNNLVANKKNKNAPEKKKASTFKEIASELNLKELKHLLETVRSKFPETPSIWLKDLASFLNVKLNMEIPDPVFANQSPGFPTSALPLNVSTVLRSTVLQCTEQTLQLFYEHCLTTMVQDINKNFPTFGFRIFLQILAKEKPEIVLNNLTKLSELRNSCQNRHQVCLSILWAAGQAGLNDTKAGLKIWLELLFPIISMRAFSKYANDYLEFLLRLQPQPAPGGATQNNKDQLWSSDVLGVREFFPILDLVHLVPPGSPSHKQLHALYPKLKSLAYGPKPETILRNFFPSYLTRLQNNSSPAMKQELLSSLLDCLTRDKHSYSIWRQLYTKHLTQSGVLLRHLSEVVSKKGLPAAFPTKMLQETLNTFRVTNEEMIGQKKTLQEGFQECNINCQELLSKMSSVRFPYWRFLVLLLFCSLGGLVFYDVSLHGSFKASKIGRCLKDFGVLAVWDQATAKIAFYSQKTYKYLERTVPGYYSVVSQWVAPYLTLFWENLFALAAYVWEASAPLRQWLNLHVPPVLNKMSEQFPEAWSDVTSKLASWSQTSRSWLLIGWGVCINTLQGIWAWLQEHVFTGEFSASKLQNLAVGALSSAQEYGQSAYHWLVNVMSRV